ncbi:MULTISPECIES: NFACT RNA binding domain-containing protein [unclassified Campylobacter]|uniref:NFACT RNA binding domain-containing protein n=1 Tax=unclassified Campylobacter TaxID=2593542 RepID=UPI00123802A7|nr:MULTISPECIES: NFACT RNA binding domain-containing protein [unclassified Campylobacter]KAA6224578.1 DUF814 domain-containing protein [Campylobacter sp. LR185c]KAA6224925.1 DUF814 domain-containing protein [Campylobacter sp. LR196d]KAA6225422.1 DUF814 domain-containing protein [Campylobacter sp. LR286c]KAA6229127.1 DUF814 domain-containing protein [Campylobacter sp. LR291e]KAA6229610.1 DUF814 domain-containing protein [Campylobacter sp. LR264d]
MKYMELLLIKDFFTKYKKIDFIKRIDDNVFELSFDKEPFIFDLNRNESAIYQAKLSKKDYNAPFDFMLKKYLNSTNISKISLLPNNRVLVFKLNAQRAYKHYESLIYFEFTGKNTNVIITDTKNIIIEALRHIDKSYRVIKPGLKLESLKPFKMDNKNIEITNFKEYFQNKFKAINNKKMQNTKENKILQINKKINALKENLTSLQSENECLERALNLSKKADILFANLSKLKDYEREFSLLDFEENIINFKLEYSPKESANLFYKEAKKAKQRAKNINIQRQNLNDKLKFYENLKELLSKAVSLFELEILLPKKTSQRTKQEKKEGDIAYFYFNDYKIGVGKNENGNELLLKSAKKDDLWFHVKNFSSSHAILYTNKQKISEEVVQFTAKICVNFSNLKPGTYLVDYTSRNFVKIRQKAFVNYTNFKSINIIKE